jgi:hypothetical protein
MIDELLQSFVRSGNPPEEEEPSRLYQSQPKKEEKKDQQQKEKKKVKLDEEKVVERKSQFGSNYKRKQNVVIEQRKVSTLPLALDECYCDKDRAAAVSFGVMDIKAELRNKHSNEKNPVRIETDETDTMAWQMLGMMEIKNNNLDNGVKFLTKVGGFGEILQFHTP